MAVRVDPFSPFELQIYKRKFVILQDLINIYRYRRVVLQVSVSLQLFG